MSRAFSSVPSVVSLDARSFLAPILGVLSAFGSSGLAAGETPPIVFVSRAIGSDPDAATRLRAIERATTGKLRVLEGGGPRTLVDAGAGVPAPGVPIDVADPDVSFDGSRIVFSGYSQEEGAWRIYEIGAGGEGFRQLTRSDRTVDLLRFGGAADLLADYDDVDPCYLPDGRICFVSTRYPGVAPDGRLRATNLFVMNADGSNLHRITTERFGADTPAVEPATGLIVYSRWWRTAQIQADPTDPPPDPIPPGSPEYGDFVIDESNLVLRGITEESFPGVNSWFLSSVRPDGTDLVMYTGFRLDRELTQAYRPSFLPDGTVLALFIPKTPFLGYPRGNGLRVYGKGPSTPSFLGGPQAFPRGSAGGPRIPVAPPPWVYASAAALPDGRILVTAAAHASPAAYGIYIQESSGLPVLLHDTPGEADLDAVPLIPRALPPVLPDRVARPLGVDVPRSPAEAVDAGGSFTFLVENIHSNAPVDVPMPHAPPIGRRLAIEFWTNPQRTSPSAADMPILIQRVDIPPSGKVEVSLPAGMPLFEVLRRPDGAIPLGRDGQIFHVGGFNFGRAGETNRCVGCHAGHSQLAVPEDPAFTNVAPSAVVKASSEMIFIDAPGPQATNLVDRRTDPGREWATEADEGTARLRWSTTLRAREVVIYGVRRVEGSTLTVNSLGLSTSLKGATVEQLTVSGPIEPGGTRVALNPELDFSDLALTIRRQDVTGEFHGTRAVGLAEVEVIARATGEPQVSFLRGDADCNAGLTITDSIVILNHLFLGGRPPCCMAAADVNDDTRVDISDSVFELNFLFLGGGPIPPPFPDCDSGPPTDLSCDVQVCP